MDEQHNLIIKLMLSVYELDRNPTKAIGIENYCAKIKVTVGHSKITW